MFFSTLSLFIILAVVGLIPVFMVRPQLETAADTLRALGLLPRDRAVGSGPRSGYVRSPPASATTCSEAVNSSTTSSRRNRG